MSIQLIFSIILGTSTIILFGCIYQHRQETQPMDTSASTLNGKPTAIPTVVVENPKSIVSKPTSPTKIESPVINPEIHVARGDISFQSRSYQKAIENYESAIKLDPNHDRAYHKIGIVYFNLGLYEKAIEYYEKAIDINPNKIEAYHGRGIVYHMMSNHQKGVDDLTKALEIDDSVEVTDSMFPLRANIYHNRGFMYLHMEQYQNALADFEKAIDINPRYTQAITSRKALLDSGILDN